MSDGTRITIMTEVEATRAYIRFVSDWLNSRSTQRIFEPTFQEWRQHKNVRIVGDEEKTKC
jgi:hypothetical protein